MSSTSACPGKACPCECEGGHRFSEKGHAPTQDAKRAASCAGFTLLEVMAVMLIIALVASVVVTMTPVTGRAGLKAVTLQSAALLRRERAQAILGGRPRRVSLDGGRRMLVGDDGDAVPIPRDVAIDVLGADAVWSGRRAVVRFDPDGASTGAVLRLSHEQAEYEIRVNWFTGGVAVSAP